MMGRECGSNGRHKGYVKNFGGETS